MTKFWYDSTEKFHIWGLAHNLTILFIILVLGLFYVNRKYLFKRRHPIRISVGLLLIFSRVSLDVWYVSTGQWRISYALPFELCSLASLLCGVMLLTQSKKLFKPLYFIALSGATQAILTPELNFGFPQFRFFQFFLDHTLLILAPFIMIWLFHFTLQFRDVFFAFITINLLALFAYTINLLTSGNYMFLMHKPDTPSLLDYLGEYPYYLLSLEGMAIIIFFVLYYFYHLIK